FLGLVLARAGGKQGTGGQEEKKTCLHGSPPSFGVRKLPREILYFWHGSFRAWTGHWRRQPESGPGRRDGVAAALRALEEPSCSCARLAATPGSLSVARPTCRYHDGGTVRLL